MSVSPAASSMSVFSGERSDLHSVSSRPPRYHSQSRAGLWQNKKKRFLEKAQHTHKELLWASRNSGQKERSRLLLPSISTRKVTEQDLDEQESCLEEMLAAQDRNSHGLPPPPKGHDTLRIILNNVNVLQLFAKGREKEKIGWIETTRKNYQSDIYCCVENRIQWDMATSDQQFDDIFVNGEERYSSDLHSFSVGFSRYYPLLPSCQYITSYLPPVRDTEGSIRFRRRRRRRRPYYVLGSCD